MSVDKIIHTIQDLIGHIEKNTCPHEETYRGGTIWEICSSCGAKWADNEGGKPAYTTPKVILDAEDLITFLKQSQTPISIDESDDCVIVGADMGYNSVTLRFTEKNKACGIKIGSRAKVSLQRFLKSKQ